MKKPGLIFTAAMLISLLSVTACQTDGTGTHTSIPVKEIFLFRGEQEAPDDIMPVPGGGPAYRANVGQPGIESPWSAIEVSETDLGSGSSEAHIYYRSSIQTPAGETRNNVIKVIIPDKDIESLALYADTVPPGIVLTDGMQWSGPSTRASVLVIEIAPDIAPGEYPLEIGLVINGKDYGTVTCTIKVIEGTTGQPEGTLRLDHAKPYLVVGEGNLSNEDPGRSVGFWFITSNEASGFEEYAQTAAQAALDLYTLYKRTFTSVLLIPQDGILINYAQANFATDGKGAAGMTGSAPAVPGYWKVRASIDPPLTEQELAIAELWSTKQQDFPQQNPVSSLSYDAKALRQYIADTLNIPYTEVRMPYPQMREYELNGPFIDWTVSYADQLIYCNPGTEVALTYLQGGNFIDFEKASINALVNEVSEEIKSQFILKYETAEEVSMDSIWMASSSWRPYMQSDEYRQLLEFCRMEGQSVWPLILIQLDSENPYFAGGLFLDVTLPKYLYYLEKTGEYNREEGNQCVFPCVDPDILKYVKELLYLVQGG
jgi:hypothetical protein